MGRAARNISGEVIIYADTITKSMKSAIEEVDRRREYQIEYNTKHNITPRTIVKKIQDDISQLGHDDPANQNKQVMDEIDSLNLMSLTPQDKNKTVKKLEREMKKFADDMDFESAILLRDTIQTIKQSH